MLRLIAATAFLSLTPAIVWAQDAPSQNNSTSEDLAPQDWTLARLPEHDAVAATIGFTSGLNLIARCQGGVYDLMISGLPEVSERQPTRQLAIQVGDEGEPKTTVWTVGSRRTMAFSRIPAMVARDLAEGGKLQILVPPEQRGGPRTRYVMDVEPSNQALAETLSACDLPLVDPRQARSEQIEGNGQDGLPPAVAWRAMPRPNFPESVRGRSPRTGYVVLSCVAEEDGRLTECQTESEQPAGYNLGQAVQRSLPRSRLKLTDEAAATGEPLAGRMILFTVNFKMEY